MNDPLPDISALGSRISENLGGNLLRVVVIMVAISGLTFLAGGPGPASKVAKFFLGLIKEILVGLFRAVWWMIFTPMASFDKNVVNKKKKKPGTP